MKIEEPTCCRPGIACCVRTVIASSGTEHHGIHNHDNAGSARDAEHHNHDFAGRQQPCRLRPRRPPKPIRSTTSITK